MRELKGMFSIVLDKVIPPAVFLKCVELVEFIYVLINWFLLEGLIDSGFILSDESVRLCMAFLLFYLAGF